MSKKHKIILSIDGGGIKGIIPLEILNSLEKYFNSPIIQNIDFFAGTSSGALTVSSLTSGVKVENLIPKFLDVYPYIFHKNVFSHVNRITKGYIYETTNLKKSFMKLLTNPQIKFNEITPDILITAKRIKDGKPWYFVKDNLKNSRTCGNVRLIDAAIASASAPTFFPAYKVNGLNITDVELNTYGNLFTDGGLGVAGNPVYQSAVEAFYYTNNYKEEETTIISLGCGQLKFKKELNWIYPWLEYIIQEMLDSPWEQQLELVKRHFPKAKLIRLDPNLDELFDNKLSVVGLDDINIMNIIRNKIMEYINKIKWKDIL